MEFMNCLLGHVLQLYISKIAISLSIGAECFDIGLACVLVAWPHLPPSKAH